MANSDKSSKDNGLADYGIIYLSGEVTGDTAEEICKQIIEYNIRGDVNQIQMIINSPGGSCPAGFSIIDMMEWSRIPIYTTGIGMVASMGLLVFMTGVPGRRTITPRTAILSHRFSAFSGGTHSQLIAGRKEVDLEHERILNHYLDYSLVKDRLELEQYLLREVDTWLAPHEAVTYGLADRIESLRRTNA